MNKIMISFFIAFLLTGCSNGEAIKPNTPTNASILMELNINNQNFESFKSLFYDGAEVTVSNSESQHFDTVASGSTNYKTYELLTFSNGEMLLVEFAPLSEGDQEYKIVNVKEVPEEMKNLFKD